MELASNKPVQFTSFQTSSTTSKILNSNLNHNSSTELKTIRTSKSILHYRENSLDELESLFDPTKWKSKIPLMKRNLPQSFFKPPLLGRLLQQTSTSRHPYLKSPHLNGHVRQISSIEQMSSSSCSPNLNGGLNYNSNGSSAGYPPNHSQNNNYLANTTNLCNNNHLRSMSEPVNMFPGVYGNSNDLQQQLLNNQIANNLPYGWQPARTNDGQVYYIKYGYFDIFVDFYEYCNSTNELLIEIKN
jgi:hypothetical protein